jgi:hypothetical protein
MAGEAVRYADKTVVEGVVGPRQVMFDRDGVGRRIVPDGVYQLCRKYVESCFQCATLMSEATFASG